MTAWTLPEDLRVLSEGDAPFFPLMYWIAVSWTVLIPSPVWAGILCSFAVCTELAFLLPGTGGAASVSLFSFLEITAGISYALRAGGGLPGAVGADHGSYIFWRILRVCTDLQYDPGHWPENIRLSHRKAGHRSSDQLYVHPLSVYVLTGVYEAGFLTPARCCLPHRPLPAPPVFRTRLPALLQTDPGSPARSGCCVPYRSTPGGS